MRLLDRRDVLTFCPYTPAMRYAVLGMLLLFALGDGCSPPPNIVGVQDFGKVTGRVLDAMTNRPIPNALVSVGSLYTTRADVKGAFVLRSVSGDQTVTARAAGYATASADTTINKDATVSIGYIRLVPLTGPAGQPTLAPPATPSPAPAASATPVASATPAAGKVPSSSPLPSPTATPP
jgi:Carboxypeptidase regulatory-like domain